MGHPRPRFEVAEIVRKHLPTLEGSRRLSRQEKGVLTLISQCRTAAMGGHKEVCDQGHFERYAYNSCGNRHCPKCGALAQERWLAACAKRLLDVAHFHLVFTLVPELRPLAKRHPKAIYEAMIKASAETLLDWFGDRRKVVPGLTSVLHTWNRELDFHPHVHFMATAGGLGLSGENFLPVRSDYLFPVKAMGKTFRGKMLEKLDQLRTAGTFPELSDMAFMRLKAKARGRQWVVYAKKPFQSVPYVLEYLARYTKRVGIANSRLRNVTDDQVTFRTRGDQTLTLHPLEFLRRFLLHLLPPGFHKVRHFGLYASTGPNGRLAKARAAREKADRRAHKRRSNFLAGIQKKIRHLERKSRSCPICGEYLSQQPLESSTPRAHSRAPPALPL